MIFPEYKHWYDNLSSSEDRIICPECGTIQAAKVVHTQPWPTRIHNCIKCDYTIMESEWERVNVAE